MPPCSMYLKISHECKYYSKVVKKEEKLATPYIYLFISYLWTIAILYISSVDLLKYYNSTLHYLLHFVPNLDIQLKKKNKKKQNKN